MQTRMIHFFYLISTLLLALAFSSNLAHAGHSKAVFLTTIDSTGTPLSNFDVGLANDQFVSFVEVDSSGNIWVGRSDTAHNINQFNPNDMVVKFTPSGNELLTVKGPMRYPESIAFDSNGNIYIGGIPDGGSFVNQIYKYDSIGNLLFSFGEVSSSENWEASVFTSDDRLFSTTNNNHSVREFTTGGTQIQSVYSFDGTYRFGRGLALSTDGTILWNYQPKNGPGEDFIVAYDLDLNVLSYFGLDAFGTLNLWGLDTLSNGNLVARDALGSRILEFSPTGTLVNEIDILAIDMNLGFRRGFAVDSNDNFLITHVKNEHTISAEDAYNVLITDPTAVMFDTRTVDEHNGYCPPWDQDCGGQIDTDTAYTGTPQWAIGSVEKLPITLPYWYAGVNRNTGPPEDEAQVRNIIEGALAANIIGFDTPIYLISSTAYRSYHMTAWMSTQTFTNPVTKETALFTNMFNIDFDADPDNAQGGIEEWNAASLPIFDGTIVPPQILSGYPKDGSTETSTNDVIFVVGVLEPTTGGFVYSEVSEVLLYVDGNAPVSMPQMDEAALRAFFSIPDDVVIPGKVYMVTQYLPDGVHTWNVSATNSAGTSWNLHVLDGSVQGPGQRTLTVDACSPSGDDTDCNGRDDDCDGIPDDGYMSTDTNCGVGICAATGQTKCIDGAEIDTCTPGTPAENPEATCDDNLDNDCDGLTDTDDSANCPLTYNITATAGSGGSISPSGNVTVDAGNDQTFTITPWRGYQVSDVLVDGVSIGRVISYTFTNLSFDHIIQADFTKRGIRRGMRRGRGRDR